MVEFTTGSRGEIPGKGKTCHHIRSSVHFFIDSVLHQQPDDKLQIQHNNDNVSTNNP
jgi:hypothetical protein